MSPYNVIIQLRGDNMQISRLFEIVYLLLDKKKMTGNELASHFEVSKRTILRDIEALSMAGIPIYTTRGKGGGISILDSFVLNKATISEEEQNQILMSLQSLASTQQIDTNNILSKLGALFEKTDTAWIEVDFSRWGNKSRDKEKFEIVKNVILKKISISFNYSSTYGEITKRTVYPLKLVFKSKGWYVQAFCLLKDEYRTFKINRIFDIEVLAKSFSELDLLPPPIDVDNTSSYELVPLKLSFSQDVAYRVYDEFDTKKVSKSHSYPHPITGKHMDK